MTVPVAAPCVGAAYHSPRYIGTERHHVCPREVYVGLGIKVDSSPANIATLCGTCHNNITHVWGHLTRDGTQGGHRFGAAMQAIVDRGWAEYQRLILLYGGPE